MKEIILASNSPRRKEILSLFNVNFKVETKACDELYSINYDEEIIKKNSIIKAYSVIKGREDKEVISIAADTMVILDSVCLVKPQNVIGALFMLKKLSDKTHFVVTSHTITNGQKTLTEVSKSYVTFRKLNFFEIIKYIITKKPLDKAGSYGIQDFLTPDNCSNPPKKSFIKKLEGSYYNVMGLDIELVLKMLKNF